MIHDFQAVLSLAWDIFGLPFTIYGFTMSFKAVMFWSLAAGLVLWFIGRLFNDG